MQGIRLLQPQGIVLTSRQPRNEIEVIHGVGIG